MVAPGSTPARTIAVALSCLAAGGAVAYLIIEQNNAAVARQVEQHRIADAEAAEREGAVQMEELFIEGERWYGGFGNQVDYSRAVKCWELGTEGGHAAAAAALGWCHLLGRGVDKSETKAEQLCTRAVDQLGLLDLAATGHAGAQNNLGLMSEYGKGVEQDVTKAVEWYAKAADQKHALAQNNLGIMYEFGMGVRRDERKAVRLYREAAAQGLAPALYMLGHKYANGSGGAPKDEAKAREVWQVAAQQGHVRAQEELEKRGWPIKV